MRYELTEIFEVNPLTGEKKIITTNTKQILGKVKNYQYCIGRITKSTFTNNTISYSSDKLDLKEGDEIKVKYRGIVTPVKIPSAKGKIYGLSDITRLSDFKHDFKDETEISITYDKEDKIMELRRVLSLEERLYI